MSKHATRTLRTIAAAAAPAIRGSVDFELVADSSERGVAPAPLVVDEETLADGAITGVVRLPVAAAALVVGEDTLADAVTTAAVLLPAVPAASTAMTVDTFGTPKTCHAELRSTQRTPRN